MKRNTPEKPAASVDGSSVWNSNIRVDLELYNTWGTFDERSDPQSIPEYGVYSDTPVVSKCRKTFKWSPDKQLKPKFHSIINNLLTKF